MLRVFSREFLINIFLGHSEKCDTILSVMNFYTFISLFLIYVMAISEVFFVHHDLSL